MKSALLLIFLLTLKLKKWSVYSQGLRYPDKWRLQTINQRPCKNTEGIQGVCMFRWDCINRKGIMLSTCLDGFLFGACCFLHVNETIKPEETIVANILQSPLPTSQISILNPKETVASVLSVQESPSADIYNSQSFTAFENKSEIISESATTIANHNFGINSLYFPSYVSLNLSFPSSIEPSTSISSHSNSYNTFFSSTQKEYLQSSSCTFEKICKDPIYDSDVDAHTFSYSEISTSFVTTPIIQSMTEDIKSTDFETSSPVLSSSALESLSNTPTSSSAVPQPTSYWFQEKLPDVQISSEVTAISSSSMVSLDEYYFSSTEKYVLSSFIRITNEKTQTIDFTSSFTSTDDLVSLSIQPSTSVIPNIFHSPVIYQEGKVSSSSSLPSSSLPIISLSTIYNVTSDNPFTTEHSFMVLNNQTINSVINENTTSINKDFNTDFSECGIKHLRPFGRIVGGKNTFFGNWPWQVLVKEEAWLGIHVKNKCGGVLISSLYVLTAAHCQPGFLGSLMVLVGEHDLTGDYELLKPVKKKVKRMIVHREYNSQTLENDLALLELESDVQFQSHIVPICLPERWEDFTGQMAYVTGWGKLSHGGTLPTVLQEVRVPIISNSRCQQMFLAAGHVKAIRDTFLCAGYDSGGQDSCEGDSGGPLMVQREDERWVLVGTVSHGIRCADPNLPGVYMRTAAYRAWIDNIVKI